ncbi:MAG TPA: hypothetical protein VGO35_10970 [Gammaproteobacteria bacterium]|jgi:hypothetical protein|nr:hypothetical protein [Gammaproteobacteria bacterium]
MNGSKKASKRLLIGLGFAAVICVTLYFTTGLFVVQPIGVVPNGATIWYWRIHTNYPFIASADGLLLDRVGNVSLLGRVVALGATANELQDKKIATFPYSRTLYLMSTGGKEFDR